MAMEALTLVANPGSASRKYALFRGGKRLLGVHFEYENGRIIYSCQAKDEFGQPKDAGISHLAFASSKILEIMREQGGLEPQEDIKSIALRVVAPSSFFQRDRPFDENALKKLTALEHKALLHINATMQEAHQLRQIFPGANLLGISDSAFHADKLPAARVYGLPLKDQKTLDIQRFGYHGLSVESSVNQLLAAGKLPKRLVVFHLGSGSSVTAVKNGEAIDCSMGYSPLEGLVMATRSGSIDIAAAQALQTHLGINDRAFLEYLNNQSGLLGLSGKSSDIRELLVLEKQGDERAKLALDTYVYRVQQAIGAMAAALGGIDTLVFTATVGERSAEIRKRIVQKLLFLGLALDPHLNHHLAQPGKITLLSPPSHPAKIYVVPADEDAVMVSHSSKFI